MTPASRAMAIAEAVACIALAWLCIVFALQEEHIAWLYGFGSLSFACDLWRRLSNVRVSSRPGKSREH